MKKPIKKLWLKALRSKKFKKGTRKLRTLKGWCCLGVLCELHRRATGRGRWENDRGRWIYAGNRVESSAILPPTVCKWAGITNGYGGFMVNDTDMTSLAGINDNTKGFDKVIKAIEKHF